MQLCMFIPPASPTDRLLLVVMTDEVSSFNNKSGTSSVAPPMPNSYVEKVLQRRTLVKEMVERDAGKESKTSPH